MKKVSAIICVYNEEKTIKDVILSVSKSEIFDEIIIVNDGSEDKTNEVLNEISNEGIFNIITLSENKGKGYAMSIGIENAKNEIVVFIDADLSNLMKEHFVQLAMPIIRNEADMVLGQATDTLINYNLNPFKSFTGERSLLKKDILPLVDKMKHSRFGVETLINLYYQSEGKKVKYIMLDKLKHPTKFHKTSTSQAVKEFVLEGHQIALTTFKNFELITSAIKKSMSKNFKI